MINLKKTLLTLAVLLSINIGDTNAASSAKIGTTNNSQLGTDQMTTQQQQPQAATTPAQETQSAKATTTPTNTPNPNENIIVVRLADGNVIIQLFPDKAPEHVKRIKELAKEGFYDGSPFHRVIDGFMVQTGDPTGTGMGKSKLPDLAAEFNDIKHVKGIVSMARAADINSANSQFFIMLGDAPSLDGHYTAFGKVISGMEFVDKIKKGDRNNNGKVINPDKIISMKVAADIPGFSLQSYLPSVQLPASVGQPQTAAPATQSTTAPTAAKSIGNAQSK